jgi:hypothetical protein
VVKAAAAAEPEVPLKLPAVKDQARLWRTYHQQHLLQGQ